jgi:non-heme Fe2+,alpha-ketoglutarate-dependent halogenase
MKALKQEQVAAFERDGFLHPFPLMDEAERQSCLDGLARYEAWLGHKVNQAVDTEALGWRTMPHLLLPWVSDLAHDPRILDPVEDLFGPDLLIWTSTFFIKEPHSPEIAAWHQDATYFALEPVGELAVWIALTEASVEAGCMEMVPFDGKPRQMKHEAHVVAHSVNRAGQQTTEPVDASHSEFMPLKAGQFSIHHGLAVHRSGPNETDHRRTALGLNFVPAHVRPAGQHRTAAMLVRGEDKYGHFEKVTPPKAECDADAIETHRFATGRYRETYREQEALHAAAE